MTSPKRPEGFSRHDIQLPFQAVSFDVEAFDQLISSHGVTVEIYSATICPLGSRDPDDAHSHMGHHECSNGFIYTFCGEVEASFLGNTSSPNFQGYGISDEASASMTVKRFYDCPAGKPVLIGHYYRLYIKDNPVVVTNSEIIEHHQSGTDRLSYPLVEVQNVIDARGRTYSEGADFCVEEGLLKWYPNKGPGYDTKLGRGIPFSIHYTYKPFYYVKHIPHEVRVTKDVDPMTGEVSLQRVQYQLLLEREWAFHDQNRKPREKSSDRDVPEPRSGGFSPR
jgi:hypothetical protein